MNRGRGHDTKGKHGGRRHREGKLKVEVVETRWEEKERWNNKRESIITRR